MVTGLHPTELSQQDLKIQFAERAGMLNPNLIYWLGWMTEPSLKKRLSSTGEALRSFDKNTFSIDKINKITLAVKPPASDIKITKNSEFIEIIIPSQGVGFNLIACFSVAFAANILLRVGAYYLWEINNLLSNSAVIMLSGTLLAAVVVTLLYGLFRELRVRIDRQQICYTSHILGLKWTYPRSVPRQEICQLEIRQYNSNIYQMIIQAGKKKYQLGEN